MTDLETFAKATTERGGEWWILERFGCYCLCECKPVYMRKNMKYCDSPTFQVFKNGARMFASTNYREAYEKYKRLKEGAENGNG